MNMPDGVRYTIRHIYFKYKIYSKKLSLNIQNTDSIIFKGYILKFTNFRSLTLNFLQIFVFQF